MSRAADVARTALATVRIVNGAAALVAPELLLRQLGAERGTRPVGVYPFRMFGVRTVLIGVDLLTLRGEQRRRAVRTAVLIHAGDTLAAAVAGIRGELPRKAAITTTAISATNTVLAATAALGG